MPNMYWIVLMTLSGALVAFVESAYVPRLQVFNKIYNGFNNNVLRKNVEVAKSVTLEDSYLNITQLARKYGYNIEQHNVTTEDGYILGLHRLTTRNRNTKGIPVFLMHGLIDSSDSWILQGPKNALGYRLVDAGFDVWMGNARGNKHSYSHTRLSPTDSGFWKFSWEEIGVYDLPAMIDYVLRVSEKENLYYVGHSQGTTSFFVMNALKPEHSAKFKMMFALSPVAWMGHATSPVLKYLSTTSSIFQHVPLFNTLSSNFLNQIYGTLCKVMSTGCKNIFDLLFGTNYYMDEAMFPVILGHSPTGSSALQFVHYWQLYESGRFRRFDYGWMANLPLYYSFSPPDYDLSNVSVPVVLFHSGNDCLSHPTDVEILSKHLPNVHKMYYSQYFSHIDYLYASTAKEAIYDIIIEDIRNFENQRQ